MKRNYRILFVVISILFQINGYSSHNEKIIFDKKDVIIYDFDFRLCDFLIRGKLLIPQKTESKSVVIYVHGSGPTNMDLLIDRSSTIKTILSSGYALLIYDKPGSGNSQGVFDSTQIITQRREILSKAVQELRSSSYSFNKIGLFGGSQAAYIAPYVATQMNIDFLIMYSCPMENSIDQGAYQIENYMLCAGYDQDYAAKLANMYVARENAKTYNKYLQSATCLDTIREIKEDLFFGGVYSKKEFKYFKTTNDRFINPVKDIPSNIPVLAIYGKNDKNIDPYQALEVLKNIALNKKSKIKLIEKADHNMVVGGNGCIQEQIAGYRNVSNPKISDDYLQTIKTWLKGIK